MGRKQNKEKEFLCYISNRYDPIPEVYDNPIVLLVTENEIDIITKICKRSGKCANIILDYSNK